MPMVSFFMDTRGDPYGKKRFPAGGGHHKALHLQPFLMSVQRGPEVLLLASADPGERLFTLRAPQPTCLLSHVVVPADVTVWFGDSLVECLRGQPGSDLDVVLMREHDLERPVEIADHRVETDAGEPVLTFEFLAFLGE